MKFNSLLSILLIAALFFLDTNEAKRYSGGGRSYSKPSYYKPASYKPSSTYTKKTYKKITRSNGSSFSGSVVVGTYHPYGTYILIPGVAWYDPHYRYYYDGHATYRQSEPASPVLVIVIIVIIILILCVCCYIAKNQSGDEYHEEVEVHEETTYETTYEQGTYSKEDQPVGTVACNEGHIMQFINHDPYGGGGATCDNCNQQINFQYPGGWHCQPCEVDLCKNCGDARMKQAFNPGFAPQQPMMQPPAYPPQQMPGQPPMYAPQQMPGQPPMYPPQQMPGQPPMYPPQQPMYGGQQPPPY